MAKVNNDTQQSTSEENKETIQFEGDSELVEKSEEIVRKLDKESATRIFTSESMKKFLYIVAVLVSCYHLYTAFFGPPVTLKHRSLHVAMMLSMAFIMYPFSRKCDNKKVAWYDWIFVVLSCAVPFYVWTDYLGVVERAGRASETDMVIATLLVVGTTE